MGIGNIIVGQSGGPTSVINSSLAGVFKTARDRGAGKIFGMVHGIQGFLEGNYIDMTQHVRDNIEIELLKRTPSAFLGSCRYKLPTVEQGEETYGKIFDNLKKLDVQHFFYIGGNDSMDTIKKLSQYADYHNIPINFMGVPKTVDNDLAMTDHTPGYGSAAKYIATICKELMCDTVAYGTESVTIVEIMGRNAGWLTAASALAADDDCAGPDMIFLPERAFDMDKFLKAVQERVKRSKTAFVCISEGIKDAEGKYVCEAAQSVIFKDSFGHASLGGAASFLGNMVSKELGIKSRSVELSTLQRCAAHFSSRTDVTEAFLAGGQAVRAAFSGESGKMVMFERVSNDPYDIITTTCDVRKIANVEKKVPEEWITKDGTHVTKDIINYMKPLIQAELSPFIVDGLPRHLHLNKELILSCK